jgi:hypothetical protein
VTVADRVADDGRGHGMSVTDGIADDLALARDRARLAVTAYEAALDDAMQQSQREQIARAFDRADLLQVRELKAARAPAALESAAA